MHPGEDAGMRGEAERQRTMLSVVSAEHRIPADHPLRRIKAMADAELARLSPVFDRMYAERGRPSVPPERLLKACLLIALYSVRSERQLCEQLQYNLLFQWFLDLDLHTAPFDASTFAKNQEQGALAAGRRRPALLRGRRAPSEGGPPAVGRALHGGWDPHRGVGLAEELPAQWRTARKPPAAR